MESVSLLKALLRHLPGVLFSFLLGILGGTICGAAILSLNFLSKLDGVTGGEHFRDYLLSVIMVGAMYGGPVGAIMGPLGYATVVRTTGFKRAILPATIGTIVGGYVGSLASQFLGVPTGIAGFFIALHIVRYRYSIHLKGPLQLPTP